MPNISKAQKLVKDADILVVIGTSMQVAPAASLVEFKKEKTPMYIINPQKDTTGNHYFKCTEINEPATKGVQTLIKLLK